MKRPVAFATGVSLLLAACGGDQGPPPPPEPPAGYATQNLVIVPTPDSAAPVMILGNDGSRLVPFYTSAGAVDQAVLTASGDQSTVYFDGQRRPSWVVAGTTVVVFGNWSPNTVDLAAVQPDGSIQTARRVPIPAAEPSGDPDFEFSIGPVTVTGHELERLGSAVSSAMCPISARPGWTSPAIIDAALAGCTSDAVSSLAPLSQEEVTEESAETLGQFLSRAGCASQTDACINATVNAAANRSDETDAYLRDNPGVVRAGEGVLLGGSGHVQVTLTWNAAVDVDLYLTDPSGFEIWTGATESPSGGRLDFDDIDGYGPENIYWPERNAPSGSYSVRVVYFAGLVSPVTWTVLVTRGETTETHTGTLSAEGDTTNVASFTVSPSVP